MSQLRSRRFVLIAMLLTLALFGAACAEQDDTGTTVEDEGDIQEGGTILVGAEQEPAGGLNVELVCCTLAWGEWIQAQVLEGALKNLPDFSYAPNIAAALPEITEDPFTLTYTIKDEAVWSDNTPITADDFEFTWETYINPDNDVASRDGYDDIDSAEIVDDKTIAFTFKDAYAGWRDLFNPLLPKHALEGENFNKVWNKGWVDKEGNAIGSGPFLFESYNKGADLTLVPNDNWWGEGGPYVDEIVFRFLPETNTEIQSLRGGEVDMIYPQPQLELESLLTQPDLEVETNAGTTWEHIDIQVGENGHPALREKFVREALALAIDREALVEQLFGSLSPDLTPLHNTIYMQNQEEYVPNWETYTADPAKAEQLLKDGGCTKEGDVYVCNGEPLEFEFTSTSGNALRELAFEVIQEQLRPLGIKLTSGFGEAAVVFGNKVLVQGNYDLFMFAWVGTADPGGSVEIWKCEGSQNFTGYCNEEVTQLLEDSNLALDPAARGDLMNEADRIMSEDIPTIPLYQKPTFFAYNTKVHGLQDNPTQEGFTWNSEHWWIEQ
jgi:peptide/nickel transport system substrate-binding protein